MGDQEGLFGFGHTNKGHWILIEADPDADCKNPRGKKCDKMYFNILNKTRVLREQESNGKARSARASAADLKKDQRVRAWTVGPYAASYPGQAQAHTAIILEPG